jgi:predicted RNA-binding Zn-ribbon protein involved in translation (DUF1610 family)
MFKKHAKITDGYVIQTYITLPNGTLVCQGQEFIAGEVHYEDDEGQFVEVDVSKEVYCPFEMKDPKQIPSEDKEAKFACPACGCNRIEACLDGNHTTAIEAIWKDGGIEYGDTYSNGVLLKFQCAECAETIKNVDGSPITDDDELVAWIKDACK